MRAQPKTMPDDLKDYEADGFQLLTPEQALKALCAIVAIGIHYDILGRFA